MLQTASVPFSDFTEMVASPAPVAWIQPVLSTLATESLLVSKVKTWSVYSVPLAKAWAETELEDQIKRAVVSARIEKGLTQAQLADRSGLRQSNISRIENGSAIPTLQTLNAIAYGTGKKLKISFEWSQKAENFSTPCSMIFSQQKQRAIGFMSFLHDTGGSLFISQDSMLQF